MSERTKTGNKRFFWNTKYELDYCDEITGSEYLAESLKSRLKNLIVWDIRNAIFNKRLYNSLMFISIFLGASVPVLTVISASLNNPIGPFNVAGAIAGAIVSISASSINLFDPKRNWLRYRTYAEMLKNETFKYIAYKEACDIHKKESKAASDSAYDDFRFIEKIYNIITMESEKWQSDKRDDDSKVCRSSNINETSKTSVKLEKKEMVAAE